MFVLEKKLEIEPNSKKSNKCMYVIHSRIVRKKLIPILIVNQKSYLEEQYRNRCKPNRNFVNFFNKFIAWLAVWAMTYC